MIIIKGISWWLSVIRSFSNSKPGEMTKETFVTKKKKKKGDFYEMRFRTVEHNEQSGDLCFVPELTLRVFLCSAQG